MTEATIPAAAAPAAEVAPTVPNRPHLTEAENRELGTGLTDTNPAALEAEQAAADAAQAEADAAAAAEKATTEAAAADTSAQDAAATASAETSRLAAERATAAVAAAAAAKPVPPMDFAAEQEKLRQKYEVDGELEAAAFVTESNKITIAQAKYEAQLTGWEGDQQRAVATAEAAHENAWNADARAWEATHKAFVADPKLAEAMTANLAIVDKATPGLSNESLLKKAYAMTVAETGWTPPAEVVIDPEQAKRDAVRARAGNRTEIPPSLANVPSGGPVDARTTDTFSALDQRPIDEVEMAYHQMSPAQKDAYLRSAPGATATGRAP